MPAAAPPNLSIPVSAESLSNLVDPGELQGGAGPAGSGANQQSGPGNDSLEEWAHQVRQDLLTIIWWIQSNTSTMHLSGLGGLSMPVAGVAALYATPNLAEAISATNYYQISGSRNGQPATTPQLINTSKVALAAYKEIYLGQFTVGQGDFLQPVLTATGTPAITLLPTNFALRCELTPS